MIGRKGHSTSWYRPRILQESEFPLPIFKNLPVAPTAEKRPVQDTHHGITRTDDYAWFRADNWQAMFKDPTLLDPSIRAHLEAENAYMEAAMGDTKALQEKLFEEMKGRIKQDDSSVPVNDGPYAYGTLFVTGGEQPHYFRTPRDGGEKHVLLDGDKEAEGKDYFRLAGLDQSSDHSHGIWGYDDKGSEYFTLRIRNLESGEDLADIVENTGGGGAWAPDGKKLLLHAAGREPPPLQGLPPYHRRAAIGRPVGL